MDQARSKYGFCLGDRVIFTAPKDPCDCVFENQTGTVCDLDHTYGNCNVGVCWDDPNIYAAHSYHNCNGHCPRGTGRYVPHTQIAREIIDLGDLNQSEMSILSLLEV